jgi:hypothetical protein
MDILAALDILRNAPIEAFKNHTSETIATLQHMTEVLDGSLGSTIPLTSLRFQTSCNHEKTAAAGPNKAGYHQ